MCECNCADVQGDHVYHTGEMVIVVDAYPGCKGCDEGPATLIHFIGPDIVDSFSYLKPDAMPLMLAVEFPTVEDFEQAAARMDVDLSDEYGTLSELLHDHGADLIALAFQNQRNRRAGA